MERPEATVRKKRSRELAMQILFLWDSHGQQDLEMAGQVLRDAGTEKRIERTALAMAIGTWEQREVADRWIERVAPEWPTNRQAQVDRNILRLGVWELTNSRTPVRVIIDQAVKLSVSFSTAQSASFINAVLDAIVKEHQALTSANPPQPETPETPGETQAEDAL